MDKNEKQMITVGDLLAALQSIEPDTKLDVSVLVNEYSKKDDLLIKTGRRYAFPTFKLGYSVDLTNGPTRIVKHATLTFDLRQNLFEIYIHRDELDKLLDED